MQDCNIAHSPQRSSVLVGPGVGRAGSPSRPVHGLHRHPPRAAGEIRPYHIPGTYALAKHTPDDSMHWYAHSDG